MRQVYVPLKAVFVVAVAFVCLGAAFQPVLNKAVFRAEKFEVWDTAQKKVEFELASEVRSLRNDVQTLRHDLSLLSRGNQSQNPSQPVSSAQAISDFTQLVDEWNNLACQIQALRKGAFPRKATTAELELANSLELKQRALWPKIKSAAELLPPSHGLWRKMIEEKGPEPAGGLPFGMVGGNLPNLGSPCP